jgi:hypothetical protein
VGAGQTGGTIETDGWSGATEKTVLFRPHLGFGKAAYERSMAAATPMNTLKDLTDLIEAAEPGATLGLLGIRAYGLDSRNGWYSHHVNITKPDGRVVLFGFTNGPL